MEGEMDRYVGLGLLGASLVLFLAALPRRGEVVGFLRGRDGLQAAYMIALILLLCMGLTVAAGLGR
jgi:hypothetical protein